jgi:hypothetical protein
MIARLLSGLAIMVLINFSCVSYAEDETPLRPMSDVDYVNTERLPAAQSKQIIADIINSRNLKGERKSAKWTLKEIDFEEPDLETPAWIKSFSVIFATFVEYLLWILLALIVVSLYLSRQQWMQLFSSEKEEEAVYQAPEVLFGMNVREDSLPDDLIAEVTLLWQQQKARESLSLLYRGALIALITKEKVPLENSYTEGDILKLSQKILTDSKQHYLSELTRQWQLIAYAHRIPMDEAMEWLFSHWASDFAYQITPSSTRGGM